MDHGIFLLPWSHGFAGQLQEKTAFRSRAKTQFRCNNSRARSSCKATYRFFDNQRVTPERLIRPLAAATARTCAGQAVVYAVQDTTSLNYTNLTRTTGLGPSNDSERARGLHVRSTLALDERGVVAGLRDSNICARPPAEQTAGQTNAQQRQRPIEDKESFKWLNGIAAARAALATL